MSNKKNNKLEVKPKIELTFDMIYIEQTWPENADEKYEHVNVIATHIYGPNSSNGRFGRQLQGGARTELQGSNSIDIIHNRGDVMGFATSDKELVGIFTRTNGYLSKKKGVILKKNYESLKLEDFNVTSYFEFLRRTPHCVSITKIPDMKNNVISINHNGEIEVEQQHILSFSQSDMMNIISSIENKKKGNKSK